MQTQKNDKKYLIFHITSLPFNNLNCIITLKFLLKLNILFHLPYTQTNFIFHSGQNTSEPTCFQAGECSQSLFIDEWQVNDAQSCLTKCKKDDECLYFTFYKDESLCVGFANCVEFQDDSCTNCYSGDSTCEGTLNVYYMYS